MYQVPYTQPHHMHHETSQGVFSPVPTACHGFCNHGFTPAYYNQPYPYYPPPMPFYYYGPYYPSFPPMNYSSPNYYPIDQHEPNIDKNQSIDHHCCGCSGNRNNFKEDPHVKIEKQEPNIEKLSTNNARELKDSTELDIKQMDHNPCDLRKEDNVEPAENQNQIGAKNKFPFPIFWVPCEASEEGKDDKRETSVIGPEKSEEKVGPEEMGKKNKIRKLIPVKQVDDNEETRGKEIVKEKGDRDKKISENVTKSKLPPVCLRVEPLRKRKNGKNGNSRSLSPVRCENKPSSCAQNEKIEVESKEGERKAIEVVDGKTTVDIRGDKELRDVEAKESEVTNKIDEETYLLEKNEKEQINALDKNKMEEENCEINEAKKKLSVVEAAVMIQCAYRGFEVRRWDPLKKLRQISEIRDKVAEIRSRIEALEASSDKKESDDKQRVVIAETIMSLLLKLDTIQGLCPTVREIRKIVAKELVSLQEKLDSLANTSSKSFTVELVEERPAEGQDEAGVGHDNDAVAPHAEIKQISCTGELNDEKNVSSVVREKEEDLNKLEIMATVTNDSEPIKHNEQILKEMCEELQVGDNNSSSIDVIDAGEANAVTEELQELVGDEIKCEIDIKSDNHYRVKEECNCLEKSVNEDPKPEESQENEEVPIHDNMKQDLEGNQVVLENKYVVETENVEKTKNMETVETGSREEKMEIGGETGFECERKLVEENEKLREMVAKLVEAGKEQLSVISSLSNRVKDMEMKLGKKKNPKMRRIRVKSSRV